MTGSKIFYGWAHIHLDGSKHQRIRAHATGKAEVTEFDDSTFP